MIHDMNHNIPPFDDAAREREWLAQENAMRRERLHLDPHSDDARTKRYRMLARALRQPLDENLPPDFARQLAAQVGAANATPRPASGSGNFELGLTAVLCLALLVSSIVVSVKYGDAWLRPLIALSPSTSSSWRLLLALAACMAFTGLIGRIRPTARKR
jgi:hypothetical protein